MTNRSLQQDVLGSSLRFLRMSSVGNTFFIIFDPAGDMVGTLGRDFPKTSRKDIVSRLGDLVSGHSVDGVLFLETGESEKDYQWDFYNRDGSCAEMCGNAMGCVAKFLFEQVHLQENELRVKTLAGEVHISRPSTPDQSGFGDTVRYSVEMPLPMGEFFIKDRTEAGETFSWFNSGVPHVLIRTENIDDQQRLRSMAKKLRPFNGTEEFSQGSNVTFYQIEKENEIRSVTFERGVEDFTLGCGTGIVAAAYAASGFSAQKNRILVKVPGGEKEVLIDGDPIKFHLQGSSEFQFELRFERGFFDETV